MTRIIPLFAVLLIAVFPVMASNPATPPTTYLNTNYVTPPGTSTPLSSGGDLQAAINVASPGDEIVLIASVPNL